MTELFYLILWLCFFSWLFHKPKGRKATQQVSGTNPQPLANLKAPARSNENLQGAVQGAGTAHWVLVNNTAPARSNENLQGAVQGAGTAHWVLVNNTAPARSNENLQGAVQGAGTAHWVLVNGTAPAISHQNLHANSTPDWALVNDIVPTGSHKNLQPKATADWGLVTAMAAAYRHQSVQLNSQPKGGLSYSNSNGNGNGNGSQTAPASSHYEPQGTGNGGVDYHSQTAPASSHYESYGMGNGGVDYHSQTAPASSHSPPTGTGNGDRYYNSGTAPASSYESIQANGTADAGLPTGTALADHHDSPAGLANGGVSDGNGNGNGNGTGTALADSYSPPAGLTNGGGNGASANPIATLDLQTAPENSSVHEETDSLELPDGETVQVLTAPAEQKTEFDKKIINEALHSARVAVGVKIQEFIDKKRGGLGSYEPLYEMLADYPFRTGKMLRPTMCLSVARAVGGMGQSALTTAAALELYHNAFLIHDDIEDGSEARRGKDTLHHMIGIPRAINVGDATNVLAVGLLLENLPLIGVSKTLDVLHEIELMAQQSVEGQAMELDWVATNASNLTDQDYFKMCVKKTCWYSFMTPCRIGLIVGHPSAHAKDLVEPLAQVTRFGMVLGIAFQIQDDLLNLQGDVKLYGKEIGGDIYEGKRTLMLNHAIAHSSPADSQKIVEILAVPREEKTPEQVEFIYDRMQRCGSIDHGWNLARTLANQASEIFEKMDFLQRETPLRASEQGVTAVHDRRFLKELIDYVIYRNV
jgi:geranylgeranyl diphosphate synthase type II